MNRTTRVTPVRVADLLVAEDERMPVYVHVIDHADGRVLVDTGMTELHPLVADMDPRLRPLNEQDFGVPVVSFSRGDAALFRVGGLKRSGPTTPVRLASGDAVVLGGEGRLAFHGVDRILPGTSTLLPEGGRINITLRRVTKLS